MNTERRRPQPEQLDLRILHEDDCVLVIDKPPGIVVHPTYKNSSGTLLNGVLWHVRDRPDAAPGILTRLDKNTSGLVVIGITAGSHARMQKDAMQGLVSKTYLAIVGRPPSPPSGRIVLPLGRDSADRRVVVVRDDGQPCETRYDTLAVLDDGNAVLACEPITGRTHQIRVHLAASGWPIVGDPAYGVASDAGPDAKRAGETGSRDGAAVEIGRQALHAWKMTLPHPVTRQRLELTSPVPEDMRAIWGGSHDRLLHQNQGFPSRRE
jgi:RluA family pseudouridine synthase